MAKSARLADGVKPVVSRPAAGANSHVFSVVVCACVPPYEHANHKHGGVFLVCCCCSAAASTTTAAVQWTDDDDDGDDDDDLVIVVVVGCSNLTTCVCVSVYVSLGRQVAPTSTAVGERCCNNTHTQTHMHSHVRSRLGHTLPLTIAPHSIAYARMRVCRCEMCNMCVSVCVCGKVSTTFARLMNEYPNMGMENVEHVL